MRGLLADISAQGQVEILRLIFESEGWRDFWQPLGLRVRTFADEGLAPSASDAVVWRLCQQQGLVLITGNRNAEGPDSLEETIRRENQPDSLPVFTLADIEAIRHSRAYAERVVERALDYLMEIDRVRGAGRLYLP
jgi:hypothetical protein